MSPDTVVGDKISYISSQIITCIVLYIISEVLSLLLDRRYLLCVDVFCYWTARAAKANITDPPPPSPFDAGNYYSWAVAPSYKTCRLCC